MNKKKYILIKRHDTISPVERLLWKAELKGLSGLFTCTGHSIEISALSCEIKPLSKYKLFNEDTSIRVITTDNSAITWVEDNAGLKVIYEDEVVNYL